jgi:hypothetical protein
MMREFEEMLALGLDDCGLPLSECPGPHKPKPWGLGRPCSRDRSGTQFASGSSAVTRATRVPAQETWNGRGYASEKAHTPTPDQQFSIVSKALSMARPR